MWGSAKSSGGLPLGFLAGALCTIALLWMGFPDRFQDRSAFFASQLHGEHSSLPLPADDAATARGARKMKQPSAQEMLVAAEQSKEATAAGQAAAAAARGEAGEKAAAPCPASSASKRLRLPWEPMLTRQEVERGLTHFGTGDRLRALAAKLLAGQPIKAYTIGGSVTYGKGASDPQFSYASRFFEFINATFPHKDHMFRNKGMGATNSGIFAVCTDYLIDQDADIVVTEFTVNGEQSYVPYSHPQRIGYEQLLRKLLRMPKAPAVIQLHHWRWWQNNATDDCCEEGQFYESAAEAQMTVFGQYYDIPIISLRSAVYRLMVGGVAGFKVDKAVEPNTQQREYGVEKASEEKKADYFFYDKTHPADDGHKVLAELLAATVLRAAREVAAGDTALVAAGPVAIDAWPTVARDDERLEGLPPPMVPGNEVAETAMCAILESFKDAVTDSSKGFKYRPERPDAENFVAQKWAWSATEPGEWVEMEFDSRKDGKARRRSKQADEEEEDYNEDYDQGAEEEEEEEEEEQQQQAEPIPKGTANIYLTYLRSYAGGMGTANVTCESGCRCPPSTIDGTWTQDASLQQIHWIKVSQHERCRLRVTVSEVPGSAPQDGHKVSLFGLMVSHFPVMLAARKEQVEVMVQRTGSN